MKPAMIMNEPPSRMASTCTWTSSMTMGRSRVAIDQGDDHRGEDGQAAGVGERLLVEAAGVGFVGPAHLQGEEADAGHEPPSGEGGDDEGEDHRDPSQPAGRRDAERVEEVDYGIEHDDDCTTGCSRPIPSRATLMR